MIVLAPDTVLGEDFAMNRQERRTLTIEEVAEALGVGRTTAYMAARRGELPVLRIGKRLLVSKDALDAYLAAPKTAEVAP